MIVDLPPTFYWDRLGRDLPTGTLVRELSRSVRLDLTIAELLDIQSDADYYGDPGIAGEMIGEDAGAIGLVSSARATLRKVDAVLAALDPAEIERVKAEEAAAWAAGRAAREAEAAESRARAEAATAELRRQREEHPRVRATYYTSGGVVGLDSNENLKVGTIIVTPWMSEAEVLQLGEIVRGDIAAIVRVSGDEQQVRIELAHYRLDG